MKDAMADVTRETGNLASDTGTIKGLGESLRVLAGSFGLFNSVMGLSVEENKEMVTLMRNLQIALTALASIEAISNALQKEGAALTLIRNIQSKISTNLTKAQTAATGKATIAQRLFNLAAKANPYLLLFTALATVVGLLAAFSSGASKAAAAQKRLNEVAKDYRDVLEQQNSAIKKTTTESNKLLEDKIKVLEAEGGKEKEIAGIRDQIRANEEKSIKKRKENA